MLNYSLKEFTKNCKKISQVLYIKIKAKNDEQVLNLIDNFLLEENSFILSLLKKVRLEADTQYSVRNQTKFGNLIKIKFFYKNGKKVKINGIPKKNIEKNNREF